MRAQNQLLFLNALLGALCLGIAVADGAHAVPFAAWGVGTAMLFACALFLAWRESRRAYLAFLLLFFAFGAWRFAGASTLSPVDVSHCRGEALKVSGTLLEAPRIVEDAQGGRRLRYVVSAEKAMRGGEDVPIHGNLYISAYGKAGQDMPEPRIGDRIEATGEIRLLHGYGNPGRIDTVRAAKTKGITARLSAGKQGIAVERQDRLLLRRYSEEIRQHYQRLLQEAMPAQDAAAIFAMLFGGYEGIRPELLEAFTATGIVHILSVSGSHITLLAATIAWLGGLLRLRRGVTAVLVAVAIAVYCMLSGCVPPVIRSGIMGMLTFLALALDREKDARRILTLTGLAMLLISPELLFDVSFQLSFSATAGLLYAGPIMRRRMSFLPEAAAGSLAITLSAQMATLPFLAWYFNQVSLSSLLANFCVAPIMESIIVLGLFAGIAGLAVPFIGKAVFLLNSLMLGVGYEMTRILGSLPGSQVYVPTMGVWASTLYYAAFAFWLQEKEQRERIEERFRPWQKPLLAIAAACLCLAAGYHFTRPPEMAVHFIDVGQGDAALIVTPHGHAFMVDTGGSRDHDFDIGERVDVPYLLHYGVCKLDYIFLTHAHEDHAAGAGGILRKMPVGEVVIGHEGKADYAKSMLLSNAAPELSRFVTAEAGSHIDLDGVRIDILYAPEVPQGAARTGNEVSNVFRVSYGKASFLFTGDLVVAQEQKLLEEQKPVRSTVLKAGHHGSNTSSSPEFIAAVAPMWTVFCVGADNTFGHPKPQVVQRFADAGSRICRTDEDGAIVFHTDGEHMRVEKFREG